MYDIFTFVIIWLTPMIIYLLIRWKTAEKGSTISDLFSSPVCKQCNSKGYCLICSNHDEYLFISVFLIIPIINYFTLLNWLFGKDVLNLWNKFINFKVK